MHELLHQAEAFIFDLDGTLTDSEPYHVRAFREAMKTLADYDLAPDDVRAFNGNTSRALAETLVTTHHLRANPDEVAALKFEILYRDFRTEFFPGVLSFLHAWASRRPLAIASNSPGHFVRRCLRDGGVEALFQTVVTIDDVPARKPDPAMILLALERLQTSPARTLVFEDSEAGLMAAGAAGCPVVLLTNPGYELPPSSAQETAIVTWADLNRLTGDLESVCRAHVDPVERAGAGQVFLPD